MRFLIVTHDLTERNAHLMPWRTVTEVVRRADRFAAEARLLSLGGEAGRLSAAGIPAGTLRIPKDKASLGPALRQYLREWPCDLIVWPLVWREPAWRIRVAASLGIPLVGYFPGGVYRLGDVLYAVRRIGLRGALPYLLEALWPKRLQLRRWETAGFRHLIAMTEFTAETARAAGRGRIPVSTIPPGRESREEDCPRGSLPASFQAWRQARPYYLFAGPPSGIRGVYELLRAFARLSRQSRDACLVCLFRADAPLESARIRHLIEGMNLADRIYTVWNSVDKPTLEAFMVNCHGMALPFVAVPSEIPLAIIEAMRFGKPILTTRTGGTGSWVDRFGVGVPLGDTRALADAMRMLLVDQDAYERICSDTLAAYQAHPSWDAMTKSWVDDMAATLGPAT